MIKPIDFRFNEETAESNYYQQTLKGLDSEEIQANALKEFNGFVQALQAKGVHVITFQDTPKANTPDSIFPNNWVSFHEDGTVVLYPMYAENRRSERRKDIITSLEETYGFEVKRIKDYSGLEKEGKYLEGTGSMVLDRINQICYSSISTRTNKAAVVEFCKDFGYEPVFFTARHSVNGKRLAIYHTNVMMCVGDEFAVVCLDSIDDRDERQNLVHKLKATGKAIIEITEEQNDCFAGNMLQVMGGGDQSYAVMSSMAYESLFEDQIATIEKYCQIIQSPLDTIEACGGGSARCMMCEIFLKKR